MIRLLALLVAALSSAQCASGVVLLGPHSDVPGHPWSALAIVGLAAAGLALAVALWRRRDVARVSVPLWGAGVALWAASLVFVVASEAERREALAGLAVGLGAWAVVVWGATRAVRARIGDRPT